jgi:hypothetical protein
MENLDALLAILHSSNLLLSLQGVQQPCEDPSVDSSSIQNSKSSSLCAYLHTDSMPSWQSSIPEYRTSEILSSSELTTEFFFCALLALAQCPLGRALQNSKRVSVCNCVLLHSLAF